MVCFDHASGQHLNCGDAAIYSETAGNPAGPPLVLLHGGLGTVADFNGILASLPEHFRLLGIDLRGHGASTAGSARLSYAQYQADVEAVLAHLGIGSYRILGYSDGGIVAYRLAAAAPSRVQQLITLGAQCRLEADDPSLPAFNNLTADGVRQRFPDWVALYERVNPKPDFDVLVRAVRETWLDAGPEGYPNETVRSITAPTLIIRGDQDRLFAMREAVEVRSRIAGAAFMNIPFAGHAAHDEGKELFIMAVNRFLSDPAKGGAEA
jgi:pimeloyl-ACP methyl ester carboxylesterase